jgi:2-polyprenyl-3-methyl-5-hydroxy-6-metoxy-1,4-benzoquinol methylase
VKQVKGWFTMPGRPGDRTVEQQLMGLDWLWTHCIGKTVFDAGCAEGVIALKCFNYGATAVHGVELVEERVQMARKLAIAARPHVTFSIGNMETWMPVPRAYDIVLGLAILHKLADPSACARRLAQAARETVIFRLPRYEAEGVIVDRRSKHVPHDILAVMAAEGFQIVSAACDGPFGEWVGRWERV